ncbi:PAS domain S-box protein [Sphingobium bisphenolivorans]|uniref:PAS domain S-box protein n=1 Tax=Sphingobium bisphenolivorans TaxID=1335760 RepID=UPI0003A8D6F4|nr:PAS domain S-box protein [Sphingobium bisphenolivorans]
MKSASGLLEDKWTALFAASEALARARSLDDVVETVRAAARSVTGAEGITFVTCEGDECHYVAEDAIDPLWEGKRFRLSECVSGWVMRHQEAAIIPDVFADDRVPHDLYRATFVRSMAMMPVRASSVEAAIGAYWQEAGGPDPQSVDLLSKLARFAGAAINNVDLQNSLEILNRTGAAVAAERDLDRTVQLITDAGVELTGAEFGAFFYNLVDEQGESYMLYSLSGVPREAFSRFPMPRNTAVFAPTFDGEGVVRSDNIRLDPRYGHNDPHRGMPEGHLPVTSYLAVPVISQTGEVHGGLFFGHHREGRFSAEHERIVQGIAGHAAIAIDNARLNQRSEREIDARRAAENGLRESNDRFRAAVDAVQGVLWTNTPEGRMEGEQPGWTALTGQTKEEYSGYGWSACVHPDDAQGTIKAWEEAVRHRSPFLFEHRLRRADGAWRHYSIRAMPVFGADGRLEQWVGVHTDITEQRIVEGKLRELNATLEQRIEARASEITAAFESLRESERRFRILVDGVSDYAIYMLDPSGIITNWNAGAERIKGYSAEEIIGQHFSRFYTETDRDAGKPAQALEMASRTGKFESEGWRVRKDGTEFWASAVLDAIRDDAGELVGFAKITRDLTEKRAVEEQLRQSQKMEAVGQLTGGIAHDFNNLLTIITGNIDMAARWLSDTDTSPRVRRSIDNAMRGAERAAALTQRLLAFSRRQPLSPKPLELDKLVTGMAELLRRSLGELVRLEIVTSPGLWTVEADPNEIESALINLAVNARDAMPSGGTLTIETANAHLDATYGVAHNEVPPGNYVMVAVSDTGHGMPKDVLGRVFEPFFTTKEIGRGTGLGLSQVYGFVKQSGGHVNVYSEEGLGTTVKLYLPRYTGEAIGEPDRESGVAQRSSGGEVILVVEDDEDVRSYSAECLRDLGYQVAEAVDGAAALRLLEQPNMRVDLLFTDVVMPGMSGKDLCAAARALRPDLKVLYTSGYTRDSIVHGGRLDPGVELLPKPFSFEALAERVQALLDGGSGKCLLLIDSDPNVRILASEALTMAGYRTDAAADEEEAADRIAAAQGRYHAAILDGNGEFLPTLRERFPDLPVVIAVDGSAEQTPDLRCRAVSKPYSAQKIITALAELGITSGSAASQ